MLGLELPTDPRWVDLASKNLEEILTDHAYCEQKATTACIGLIQLFPDKLHLVESLSPIVTEEWGHFRMVLNELKKRKLTLGGQRKDEYVNALMQFKIKGGSKETILTERLLICALIEARSCERFRLLSIHLEDPELKKFYHQFMVAEASHYTLFLELAKYYGNQEKVLARWSAYLQYEATVIANLAARGDRIH